MSVVVDTDNACGSGRGDIDDAFALALLIAERPRDLVITTTFGNTREPKAYANTKKLASLFGSDVQVLSGARRAGDFDNEASHFISSIKRRTTILCLGPLTNLAGALRINPDVATNIESVVVVGGNSSSRGIIPPIWPHEFNLTKDRKAAYQVFCDKRFPISAIPLNVAKTLRIDRSRFNTFPDFFKNGVGTEFDRWLRRCRLLKGASDFPVWDLVAAAYFLSPDCIAASEGLTLALNKAGLLTIDRHRGRDHLITAVDQSAVWGLFAARLGRFHPPPSLI